MVQRGFYEKGATSLEAALSDQIPTPRIERETLRQRAIAACALKDKAALGARLGATLEPGVDLLDLGPRAVRIDRARRWTRLDIGSLARPPGS